MVLRTQVRMIRETKSMTQERLASLAGVSVSTIRRLEREPDAKLHPTTEAGIEFALGLRAGGLEHLRAGGDVDSAFQDGIVLRFPHGSYGDAPLGDVVVSDSYIATVMAGALADLTTRRSEELARASTGRLLPWNPGEGEDVLFDWLTWQPQVLATPVWLHRLHDSVEQVSEVLAQGLLPRPLRHAELVVLDLAWERAWALHTNSFFDGKGNEIEDPLDAGVMPLLRDLIPPDAALQQRAPSWVTEASPLHPFRWWEDWAM